MDEYLHKKAILALSRRRGRIEDGFDKVLGRERKLLYTRWAQPSCIEYILGDALHSPPLNHQQGTYEAM